MPPNRMHFFDLSDKMRIWQTPWSPSGKEKQTMTMDIRKTFRITEEQDEKLKKDAEEQGLSESQLLRLKIDDKPKNYPEIRKAFSDLTGEVNRIGVNINQITHNNNSALYSDSDKMRLMAYMLRLNEMMNKVVNDIGNNETT